MVFSFVLSGLKRKNRDTSVEVNRILNLKEKLIKSGYNPSEIDYLIMKQCNGCKLNEMNSMALSAIADSLEEQLHIAGKCLEFVKKTP